MVISVTQMVGVISWGFNHHLAGIEPQKVLGYKIYHRNMIGLPLENGDLMVNNGE